MKSCVSFPVRSCYWSYWVWWEASAQGRFQESPMESWFSSSRWHWTSFSGWKWDLLRGDAWPGRERFHFKAPFFPSSLFSVWKLHLLGRKSVFGFLKYSDSLDPCPAGYQANKQVQLVSVCLELGVVWRNAGLPGWCWGCAEQMAALLLGQEHRTAETPEDIGIRRDGETVLQKWPNKLIKVKPYR